MRHSFFRYPLLFLSGAVLYPLIEVVFRGWTHVSMALLGGICLLAIDLIDTLAGRLRKVWKGMLCAVVITQLELICGLLVNRLWKLGVWDYSHLPFHLAGQICPLFSFFWFLLSLIALNLFALERRIYGRKLFSSR
ncbi:MAG: hypothetical protein IKC69_05390 [Clostridia bacterium]|nr:hypothetical protein [Clostridia bacterium]